MKREKNKKFNLGFTLIELLVVVLIIGILAGIALPQYRIAALKAQYSRAKQTASDIRKAYEFYYTVHNEYPTKFSQLDFANKFDNASYITTTGGYRCYFNNTYHEIYCDNNKLIYLINFYSYDYRKVVTQCRVSTLNKSDMYHKLCQQETGKTAAQARCVEGAYPYCYYLY